MDAMDHWMRRPPAMHAGCELELKRILAGMTVRGIILSATVERTATHWLDGRKQPCRGKDCFCVDHEIETRVYGFVHFLARSPRQLECILELTGAATARLVEDELRRGSLRGRVLTFKRSAAKATSPVEIEWSNDQPDVDLPPAIDVRPIMDAIFAAAKHKRKERGSWTVDVPELNRTIRIA